MPRSALPLLVVLGTWLPGCGLGSSSSTPTPATWLTESPHRLERMFRLPPGSVRFDTATEHLDTLDRADLSAYVRVESSGRVDTLHDVRRLDRRPDLSVIFSSAASDHLGYTAGTMPFDSLLKQTWRSIPRSVSLRYLDVAFCQYDECGGPRYLLDSLTHVWAQP